MVELALMRVSPRVYESRHKQSLALLINLR
jgi:hypothetical protein